MSLTITIRPTDYLTTIGEEPCRVWEGRSLNGTPCLVFVTAIGSVDGVDLAKLDREFLGLDGPTVLLPLLEVRDELRALRRREPPAE